MRSTVLDVATVRSAQAERRLYEFWPRQGKHDSLPAMMASVQMQAKRSGVESDWDPAKGQAWERKVMSLCTGSQSKEVSFRTGDSSL